MSGPPFPTDRETLEKEVRVSFFVAGGPGGQHRNRRHTGVRLFHPPSGITVTATERRSRLQNLETAWERLIALLERRNRRPPPRRPTRPGRAAVERRLRAKRRQGERKRGRRPPVEE